MKKLKARSARGKGTQRSTPPSGPRRDVIVIGASLGGIEAVCDLLAELPPDLPASVFVVIHIGGASVLDQVLDKCGGIRVTMAADGEAYRHGHVYIAPPNQHLRISNGQMRLVRGPRENRFRPSIDVLFRTAARHLRERVIGVILSGELDDGAAGLYAVKVRGGLSIVQKPEEAIAPSMPRAAMAYAKVDQCLPLQKIARLLPSLLERGVSPKPAHGLTMTAAKKRLGKEPPGDLIPMVCPECHGPLYEINDGNLTNFRCHVGHAFSPLALSEAHTDALERALWIALRSLNERLVLHRNLAGKHMNTGELELSRRLEESATSAERDVALLREIIERI